MDRYFFHVDFDEHRHDTEGTELPDLRSARTEAAALLGALLRDQAAQFWDAGEIRVTVADAKGLVLWTITTMGQASAATQSFGA